MKQMLPRRPLDSRLRWNDVGGEAGMTLVVRRFKSKIRDRVYELVYLVGGTLISRLWVARGHILAGLLITAGLLFVFRGALLKGLVFFEKDTLVYYYPVLAELRRSLQVGALPL